MVKIVNGEIVEDDDPRARHIGGARPSQPQKPSGGPGVQRTLHGSSSGNSGGGGGSSGGNGSGNGQGNIHTVGNGGGGGGTNILTNDLAGLLGIQGKTINIGGQEIQQVYALCAGTVILLYFFGAMSLLPYVVLAFVIYYMYSSFMDSFGFPAALSK